MVSHEPIWSRSQFISSEQFLLTLECLLEVTMFDNEIVELQFQ